MKLSTGQRILKDLKRRNTNDQQVFQRSKVLNTTTSREMQIKTTGDISNLSEELKTKIQRGTNAVEDVEKANHLYTVGESVS